MASIDIDVMREMYPKDTETEAAKKLAQEDGYIVIVRYKNSTTTSDYTNIGGCKSESEIRGYFNSPYCHDTDIIYDARSVQK